MSALVGLACDEGLAPEMAGNDTTAGFTGTIRVRSSWPPIDSLFTLRVVAIRSYPPKDILQEYLAGTLEFSDSLKLFTTPQQYAIRKDGLKGSFAYVAVAQQYGPNVFSDWRVVGVYSASGDPLKPTVVDLGNGAVRSGIDITVDFQSPPPQPF